MGQALGILGGLGPLASAEFLLSVYEHNVRKTEQDAPKVILVSDPEFPDRTEAFLRGEADLLLRLLEHGLSKLDTYGVGRMVIACVTVHHLVPRLPDRLRGKVVSLIDVSLEAVAYARRPLLLVATNGTRRMGLFESNPCWDAAAQHVVMPDTYDQQRIHERIYSELKANSDPGNLVPFLTELCHKYRTKTWIAGCTELHRVTRFLLSTERKDLADSIVDPLLIIARNYKEYANEPTQRDGEFLGKCWPRWQEGSNRVAE